MAVVDRLIEQLAKPGTPVIECYNKSDLVPDDRIPHKPECVRVSAATGEGMDELLAQIEQTLNRGLHRCKLLLPYAQGGRIEQLHEKAQVLSCEYTAEGIAVEAIVPEALFGQLRDWVQAQ